MRSGDAITLTYHISLPAFVSDYDEDDLEYKNNILVGIRRYEEESFKDDPVGILHDLGLLFKEGAVSVKVSVERNTK